MTTGRLWWVGVAAVAIGALAGCSNGDASDDEASSVADDAVEQSAAGGADGAGGDEQASDDAAAAESGGAGTALAVDTVAVSRREVVRTGEIELVVDDVDQATDRVRRATESAEGFVSDEQARTHSGRVDLTVRVPAADFEAVRAAVSELGDVAEQRVEAQDVTAEVVDVETRVESLRASVERLQGLLARAGNVGQLAAVEGELARRETELEALLGQQRVLRDQVDLATLHVVLTADERPTPDDDAAGFGDGLRRGWVVAVDGGRFGLAAIGFLLPLAVPAVPAALAARWWLRRRSTPTPPPATG
jgi:hypothetical protein